MPKGGKAKESKSKQNKKEKEIKKPSKVAQTRDELRKEAQHIDQNVDALKQLGLIGSGVVEPSTDLKLLTKREKKKLQQKAKRNRGTKLD
ncbi:hypothetical protein EHI8A_190720 [Entamoeba histolytica HM-1:IMSS-B]|uniref:Uncharacterized protein n=4 Tax=Entamoeba histolytica TaxID=5759 RepID=A0A175JFU9_ENTHI|nr:hypothetical protein EHI8A_190720 [Entamoeba histolytica HM-1:IMSS-B]EMS12757.1 hypothetical protein KM1_068020 [Entamoeba histolytica HM-3:IMSS]ENY63053.1 unknown protein, putative [Entamoeba histolytica HM-1:IMSS-A]GAT92435.1 hypothetical protein CL6EHI_c00036 [Entamoeba histolytica]